MPPEGSTPAAGGLGEDREDLAAGVVVPGTLGGVRLDRAVAMLADLPRSDAGRLVDAGAVRLGSAPATDRSRRLRPGERLAVDPDAVAALGGSAGLPTTAAPVPFTVVHEDAELIVVDKPAGVVVHPGAGNRTGTLAAGLLERYPELALLPEAGAGGTERPGIVHRLDKETSGLMAVARTPAAYRSLAAQLADRTMGRSYLALVLGRIEADRGAVDAPIGRSATARTKMAVTEGGRAARTGYEVRRRFSSPVPATLVECRLETGRTHQIRVHMAAIGHPVLGDRAYGGSRGSAPVPRTMLHAWRLTLCHPGTGEPVSFEAAPTRDFADALGRFA
jgi:23S rRNA pseudouridine1911/1915/1917 synthase